MGDGDGHDEKFLRLTDTKEDCEGLVLESEPTANGVAWGTTNSKCYAEYGMAGSTESTEYAVCKLRHRQGTHWCATTVDSDGAYAERDDCFTDIPWNATATADASNCTTCGVQRRGTRWTGCAGVGHTPCMQHLV